MPTLKTGGATIVAIAALCLTANSVQAAIVNLVIDPSQSSLTLGGQIHAPTIGQANKAYQAQIYGPGSLSTTYSGSISIDLQPGTIQLLSGASIVAAVSGNWSPAPGNPMDPHSDPIGTMTNAGLAPANYGVMIPSFGVEASYRNLQFDFGVPAQPAIPAGIPSTPVAIDGGGNFNLTGQGMAFVGDTRRLLVSPLANDNSSVDGFPTLFGTQR